MASYSVVIISIYPLWYFKMGHRASWDETTLKPRRLIIGAYATGGKTSKVSVGKIWGLLHNSPSSHVDLGMASFTLEVTDHSLANELDRVFSLYFILMFNTKFP
jgi:hypothetical protein